MFSKQDVLRIRNDEDFFIDKFTNIILKIKQENLDFTNEECVYGAAVMLSYVIHDTTELTLEEVEESVEKIIDRFIQNK
jgi:hypothetical protein